MRVEWVAHADTLDHTDDVAERHRRAQQVTLDEITAMLEQQLELGLGFHAFGDDFEVRYGPCR